MRPAELYRFVLAEQVWTWTSADAEVIHGGETYTPIPISRGTMEQTEDMNRSNISIKVPRDNPLALVYLQSAPETITTITLFRIEDAAVDTLWKGRVVSTRITNSEFQIQCESVFTSLKRPGLRARYQKSCRHALYLRGCNLNKNDFAVEGVAVSVADVQVVVAEAALQANGWYLGGMLRSPDGTLRMIVGHVGPVLTLVRNIDSLVATDAVTIYPGCNRAIDTCSGKFNNVANYGGFPWIPSVNPFGGTSIA